MTVRLSRSCWPAPNARATRMLTDAPRAPRVSTRIIERLLANPTAAMAVAPSRPTMTWLTTCRSRVRTNSALTGTAMRAISRRGLGRVVVVWSPTDVGACTDTVGLS